MHKLRTKGRVKQARALIGSCGQEGATKNLGRTVCWIGGSAEVAGLRELGFVLYRMLVARLKARFPA